MLAASKIGIFALAFAVTSLWFINLCDLVYGCGCVSWWNGAAAHCNIQQPGPPDCPWCQHGGAAGYASYGLIGLAQGWTAFTSRINGLARRLLAALLAFPLVGGAAALAFGWLWDYQGW